MTILVTGSNGMIGSKLVRGLIEANYEVIGIDRTDSTICNSKYLHYTVDLSEKDIIQNIIQNNKIDRIVHLAALAHSVDGKEYTWDKYKSLNVDCAKNIFTSAKDIPVLFISTVDVFGFTTGIVNSKTKTKPVSFYAKSKKMAEMECRKLKYFDIYRFSPVYTDEIKRDIQKRYYLKYPNIAYKIGKGTEYEILNVKNAVNAMIDWCTKKPQNTVKIIKDEKRMWTPDYIREERAQGRAKVVLWIPKWIANVGYKVLKKVTGENKYTYLLNKAVCPLKSKEENIINKKEKINGSHILILEGYARQCLPFMREFKKLGLEISLLCHTKLDCGYVSRLPDHKILGICNPDEYDKSEEYIVKLIKTGRFDLVLPLVDFSASIVAKHKEELSKYATICVSDKEAFERAQDKLQVMEICMRNGIPCPKTLIGISNVNEVIKSGIHFPIVIKPKKGCGAKGFHRILNQESLEKIISKNNIKLSDMVVQECLPIGSALISDNIFIDKNGKIKSSFLYRCYRFYPLTGGTGTFNMTFNRVDIHEECARLVKMMGLRGCIGVDLMIDPRDNVAKIIEINPRILACSKIGFVAGVNQAQQIIEDVYEESVTSMMKYKSGIGIRMSQIDILWFLKSSERFKVKPSWFKIHGVKDQMFCLDDPLPWFAFLLRGFMNLKDEEQKRS